MIKLMICRGRKSQFIFSCQVATNLCCGLAVTFCGFILHLIGHKTINIPEIFSGVHSFTGKAVRQQGIRCFCVAVFIVHSRLNYFRQEMLKNIYICLITGTVPSSFTWLNNSFCCDLLNNMKWGPTLQVQERRGGESCAHGVQWALARTQCSSSTALDYVTYILQPLQETKLFITFFNSALNVTVTSDKLIHKGRKERCFTTCSYVFIVLVILCSQFC